MARVKTFLDDKTIEAEIVSTAPSSTGLLIIRTSEHGKIVRHISRLEALDQESAAILKREWRNKE